MFDRIIQGPAPIATADRFVFLVPSDRDPAKRYRVDLEAHGGNGECNCPDWRARRWPFIRDGAATLADKACCKHVARCWAYVFIACAKRIGEGDAS